MYTTKWRFELCASRVGTVLWLLTLCAFFLMASSLVEGKSECTYQGKIKNNGEMWHPDIPPFGIAKCVLCGCQNDTLNCTRTKCPDLKCSLKVKRPGGCCEECGENVIEDPDAGTGTVFLLKTERFKGCRIRDKEYKIGQSWQPISSPHGNRQCAICKCQKRGYRCRMKCPRKCSRDLISSPCCVYCSETVKIKAGWKPHVDDNTSLGVSHLLPSDYQESWMDGTSQIGHRPGEENQKNNKGAWKHFKLVSYVADELTAHVS